MGVKVLQTEIRMRDGGFSATAKDASFSIDQIKKKMKELQELQDQGGKNDAGGGVLKELKSGLGAKSTLGQLGKTLKGGGAVLGLTLIAGELGKAAANAKALKEQFDAGKISGGEMVESLAKGLPVIGGFISAGRDIKDLMASFDGLANSEFGKLIGLNDLNYAQKVNRELAATKEVSDYIIAGAEKQKNLLKEIAEEHVHINQEIGKLGLEGDAGKKYQLQVAQENRLAEIQKKRQQALDESDKRHKEETDKLTADPKLGAAARFDAQQAIQKAANAEKKKINADFDSEQSDTQKLNDAETLQAAKDHARKMAEFQADSLKEVGDLKAEARIRDLKLSGDALGAELLQIEQARKDKRAAIEKQLAEQVRGASGADKQAFTQAAADKMGGIDAEAVAATKLARKAQQEEALKTLQEGQLDVLKHQADAGDEYAAAELKRLEAAKANNDEQRKLLELLKQQLTPAERAAALAELAALKTSDHAGVVKQLAEQQADALKSQAENGATAQERRQAQKQLELLKLKKEYNEEAAKTAAILNNPNATTADKSAALANLKSYAATIGREYDKDLGNDKQPQKKTADLQERGLLITGVAAAARAQANPQDRIAKSTADAVRLQEKANRSFDAYVAWEKQNQSRNPKIIFGVSDSN